MKNKRPEPKRQETIVLTTACEIEVIEGLASFAADEIRTRFGKNVQITVDSETAVAFQYVGDLRTLNKLRLAQAAYTVERYAIPRPKALLGDAHWRRFTAQLRRILDLLASNTFQSFSLSAAGTESSVMQRIRQEIGMITGLPEAEKGDLWIRIRPGADGWETLVRTQPRPNATRAWRVCNYEASLNATVAHAMALLIAADAPQSIVNLGCGSGALLIEYRAITTDTTRLVGIDHDPSLLKCARQNIDASGANGIELMQGDMKRTPFANASIDAMLADLPFGQNVGSHEDNVRLYPSLLNEAARIARPDASFVCITHEINLIESLLAAQGEWKTENMIPVTLRGLHPRIYVLRRTTSQST